MYEIKKINPNSLAKYISIITALVIFVFGIVNFILDYFGWGYNLDISLKYRLINFGSSILFFYILFWLAGYLSALVYNLIAKKSKGLIIEFNLMDKSLLEDKEESISESENKQKEEKEDKFVV